MCDSAVVSVVIYLGCITREKSEAYLFGRKPGTYLIRDSRSIPGDFVLSVRYDRSIFDADILSSFPVTT